MVGYTTSCVFAFFQKFLSCLFKVRWNKLGIRGRRVRLPTLESRHFLKYMTIYVVAYPTTSNIFIVKLHLSTYKSNRLRFLRTIAFVVISLYGMPIRYPNTIVYTESCLFYLISFESIQTAANYYFAAPANNLIFGSQEVFKKEKGYPKDRYTTYVAKILSQSLF